MSFLLSNHSVLAHKQLTSLTFMTREKTAKNTGVFLPWGHISFFTLTIQLSASGSTLRLAGTSLKDEKQKISVTFRPSCSLSHYGLTAKLQHLSSSCSCPKNAPACCLGWWKWARFFYEICGFMEDIWKDTTHTPPVPVSHNKLSNVWSALFTYKEGDPPRSQELGAFEIVNLCCR